MEANSVPRWWRTAAIILFLLVVTALAGTITDRSANRRERERFEREHRGNIELLETKLEAANLIAQSAETEARASREANLRALTGIGNGEIIAGGIAEVLGELNSGDPALDAVAQSIATDIERLAAQFRLIRGELRLGDP